jgi:predicted PurR-regulated permease PerM
LGNYINRDFKRLATSFPVLSSQNKDKLTTAEVKIKEYITVFYDTDQLESSLKLKADSASQIATSGSLAGIDNQAIEDSFAKITEGFGSKPADEASKKSSIGIISILLMSVSYFVLILFNIEYFETLRKRYVGKKTASRFNTVMSDFNQSFVKYFALRGKIVLLLSLIYLPVFILLNMPGALLFTFLILFLSFIPYLQYLVLIPASVACLALSTEGNQSFLLYFGIVAGTFVLASIIEEFGLSPRIMEKNIGINPAIMVLSISVWTYVLGMPGLIIGLPLTSFCIIYLKRYIYIFSV